MARKRLISPGVLTSTDLEGSHLRVRYTFIALWMYLDDRGRGKDNALLIRAHTWPLDPQITERQVEKDLADLAARGLICRYVVDDRTYLHCPTWDVHQKISHATRSTLPGCRTHDNEQPGKDSGATPEPVRSDSAPIQFNTDLSQEKVVQPKPIHGDLTARSRVLAEKYLRANPLADKYETQGIVAKAIGDGGYTDAAVADALDGLLAEGVPLTTKSLYWHLNAHKPRQGQSKADARANGHLALIEKFSQPHQPAIGS